MAKMAWAKGRQTCNATIAVDEETRELARKLAFESKSTIKDVIAASLELYLEFLTKKYKPND